MFFRFPLSVSVSAFRFSFPFPAFPYTPLPRASLSNCGDKHVLCKLLLMINVLCKLVIIIIDNSSKFILLNLANIRSGKTYIRPTTIQKSLIIFLQGGYRWCLTDLGSILSICILLYLKYLLKVFVFCIFKFQPSILFVFVFEIQH